MIDSRDPNELHPFVHGLYTAFVTNCGTAGILTRLTSTYRDGPMQDYIYASGRTRPGKIVTNARAGQSFHNWRVAFDCYPMLNGDILWDRTAPAHAALWQAMINIGKSVGLESGSDWVHSKDFPHFQYTGGLTLADFQAGKHLP